MTEARDHYANVRNWAVDILRKEKKCTLEIIQEVAKKAIQAATIFAPGVIIDVESLTAELRHLFSVVVQTATVLDDQDPSRHVPWLPANRGSIHWRFWYRYMTYLERDFGMPPTVVNNLHELTDMILERLEQPSRDGSWDRRGMVVGYVQSGKTANYIGLINKAVDVGYKLVIVLAGIHSNLRAQTQLRVDEGVLGYDTQKNRKLNTNNRWVGVGKLPGDRLLIHSLTSSAEDGDFNKRVAENIGVMVGGDPVVLVIKKNSRLLSNLIKWVLHVAGTEDKESGRRVVRNVPLLLIDDEADNASINTKDRVGSQSDNEVTAINGKIRKLLDVFEKSAYVGYTATPFANIFINPAAETPEHGEDLFPRSFIINVKPPSNYVGPGKVFGLDGDAKADIDAQKPLPIVRQIDDYATPNAFPPRHKKEHVPVELPMSLKRAIRCFMLVCAARRARDQDRKHNSMLVHVTRFVNVQEHVVQLVRDEVLALQRRIEFGDGNRKPTVHDEFRDLWKTEFVPVSQALNEDAGTAVTWEAVDAELHAAASKFVILPINGYAKEALDYKDYEVDGRNVIAIGGDKLSRGLTLEGLSISYFLRTSRMYDTLMQMGRWFGYRSGYLDLCRLFTTNMLVAWYKHIALAELELRREFDYMVAAGLTPENYGLRVRTHPGGMTVTALNKMCHSQKLELSWAGVLVQTTQLPKDIVRLSANLTATENLLNSLPVPVSGTGRKTRIWKDVNVAAVATFIEGLQFPPESAKASGRQLAAFIRQQAAKATPELTSWTVALVSHSQAEVDKHRTLAGQDIGLLKRTPEFQNSDSFALRKANILSPDDESLDLACLKATDVELAEIRNKPDLAAEIDAWKGDSNKSLRDLALAITRTRIAAGKLKGSPSTDVPNGRVVREIRSKRRGLLLIYPLVPPLFVPEADGHSKEPTGLDPAGPPIIGVALSFPTSDTTLGIEYRVNRVWDAEIQEDAAYDD